MLPRELYTKHFLYVLVETVRNYKAHASEYTRYSFQ